MRVAHAMFVALLVASAVASGAAAQRSADAFIPRGGGPVHVGRAPRGVSGTTSSACSSCHAEIVREWRDSLHAHAWRDDVFQAAYAIEPMAFCRNCHAPLDTAREDPTGDAADEGVSCAICHVRDGHVWSSGSAGGPHGVTTRARFDTSAFCAPCHEFDFPGDPGPRRALFDTGEPMQDTLGEWRDSRAGQAGVACQDCHMPWRTLPDGRRYRSHAFPGGNDLELLREAVHVEARASRDRAGVRVVVTVTPGRIGHAYPTGDLFRRAELRVWDEARPEHVETVGFARTFRTTIAADGTFVRTQSSDTRVPPPGSGGATEYAFTLEGADVRHVAWSFDHLLMPTPMAAAQGFGVARNRTSVFVGRIDVTPEGDAPP